MVVKAHVMQVVRTQRQTRMMRAISMKRMEIQRI